VSDSVETTTERPSGLMDVSDPAVGLCGGDRCAARGVPQPHLAVLTGGHQAPPVGAEAGRQRCALVCRDRRPERPLFDCIPERDDAVGVRDREHATGRSERGTRGRPVTSRNQSRQQRERRAVEDPYGARLLGHRERVPSWRDGRMGVVGIAAAGPERAAQTIRAGEVPRDEASVERGAVGPATVRADRDAADAPVMAFEDLDQLGARDVPKMA
jgi:hypothetical protein